MVGDDSDSKQKKCANHCDSGFPAKLTGILFKTLNGLVSLLAVILIIFNMVVSLNSEYKKRVEIAASTAGISANMIQTFVTLSTLIVSILSGICAMGMESAGYRVEWNNDIFQIMGKINVMKIKMVIYLVFTGIVGVATLIACGLLQSGLVHPPIGDAFRGSTLGKCGDMATSLVKPLQAKSKCCGVAFTKVNGTVGSGKCGGWESNKPIGCDCDPATDSAKCMTKATAVSDFECTFDASFKGKGIWKNDCIAPIMQEYFGQSAGKTSGKTDQTGMGLLYYTGFAIGTFCCLGFILGMLIYFQDDEKLLAASKAEMGEETDDFGEMKKVAVDNEAFSDCEEQKSSAM